MIMNPSHLARIPAATPSSISCAFAFAFALGSLLVCAPKVYAQSNAGTTAAAFLEIPAGARSIAMGEAYVSMADDASAMYWNPAGITRFTLNQAAFETTEWFAGTRLTYTAAAVHVGKSTIGASVYMFDGGLMDVTTLTYPDGTGEEFSVQDISLGLTYARALTESFALGITAKMVQSRIWRMRANSVALDLGFQYDMPVEGLRMGFSIRNFGNEMSLSGDNSFVRVDLDPQNAGNNDGIPGNLLLKSWDLPLIFRLGMDYALVRTLDHSVRIAADAVYPNNNANYVNAGAEYGFRNVLFLRAGMSHVFLSETYGLGRLRAGVGLRVADRIGVDYAYSERGELGGVNTISVSVLF